MAKKKVFQISGALTEGLEETISSAHSHSGELRIEVIPIKKIEADPDNPRSLAINLDDFPSGLSKSDPLYEKKMQELEALGSLVSSIRREGIINPVVVYKYGDKYRLVAGERRTLASLIAGKHDIQAKVLNKKPTPLKLSLLQWVENVEREDLSLWERLKNLEKIIISSQEEMRSDGKITPTVLSQLIGCSLPHAMNYCAIFDADSELKTSIQENKVRNLEKAAVIAKISTPSLKDKALHACIIGATLKELKAIALEDKRTIAEEKNRNKIIIFAKGKGRQASRVNLGVTKNPQVIKCIIELVTHNDKYKHLKEKFQGTEWSSYNVVTKVFKQFIKVLEESER